MGKKIKLKPSSSQTRAEQRAAGFFLRVAWFREPKLLHTEREGAAGGRSSEERKEARQTTASQKSRTTGAGGGNGAR